MPNDVLLASFIFNFKSNLKASGENVDYLGLLGPVHFVLCDSLLLLLGEEIYPWGFSSSITSPVKIFLYTSPFFLPNFPTQTEVLFPRHLINIFFNPLLYCSEIICLQMKLGHSILRIQQERFKRTDVIFVNSVLVIVKELS